MKSCSRGNKKSVKRVKNCKGNYVCVRYGDPNMTIKKHIPSRKRSFCARHKCSEKTDPATPGYQSCKAWNCKTGRRCASNKYRATKRPTKRPTRRPTKRRLTRRPTRRLRKRTERYSKCWDGYKRSGWKTKNGRRVPNCVKK